jgi:O-antigen ligase
MESPSAICMNRELAEYMIQSGSSEPRFWVTQLLGEGCITVAICFSVLLPGFVLSPDWPTVRAEIVLVPISMAVYGWMLLAGVARPPQFHAMYILGALFCVAVATSMVYGSDILNHQLLTRDYFELPKAWLPVFFFTLSLEAELSEAALRRLIKLFVLAVILVCAYGFAQFLSLGFTFPLNAYYSGGEHHDLGLLRYGRIYSTLANPNILGQFLSWTLVTYTLAYLFQVGSRTRNVLVALACVIALTLTGSRYALIASVLGLLLVLVLATYVRQGGAKMIGLVLISAMFVLAFVNTLRTSSGAEQRFAELQHPLEVSSLRQRLDGLWGEAAGYFATSPWVGHGPAKQVFTGVYTDSEYLNVLKEYGVIGFATYISYYLWALWHLWKGLQAARHLDPEMEDRLRATRLVVCAGFAIVCMALFMNIGMFTFYNWELMGFMWLWLGLAVRAANFLVEIGDHCRVDARLLSFGAVRA